MNDFSHPIRPGLDGAALGPGFADPVADAQACFRGLLAALSEPGQIAELPALLSPPAPVSPAAAAILLTLADPTTPVCLPEGAAALQSWLGFHTGAVPAAPEAAEFILAFTRPPLPSLHAGSDEAPERGATLILDLPALGIGRRYRLTGPGIESSTLLQAPLDAGFAAEWRASAARAPRGIDILLCAGRRVIGLPRSVTIEEL